MAPPRAAPLASLLADAGSLKLSVLLRRAEASGIEPTALDAACDEAEPKLAVCLLLMGAQKLSALIQHAEAQGVDTKALDEAMDAARPKEHVMRLLLRVGSPILGG